MYFCLKNKMYIFTRGVSVLNWGVLFTTKVVQLVYNYLTHFFILFFHSYLSIHNQLYLLLLNVVDISAIKKKLSKNSFLYRWILACNYFWIKNLVSSITISFFYLYPKIMNFLNNWHVLHIFKLFFSSQWFINSFFKFMDPIILVVKFFYLPKNLSKDIKSKQDNIHDNLMIYPSHIHLFLFYFF